MNYIYNNTIEYIRIKLFYYPRNRGMLYLRSIRSIDYTKTYWSRFREVKYWTEIDLKAKIFQVLSQGTENNPIVL